MEPFAIVTDTSANLPPELIRDYNIHLIPFSYYIDGQEYSEDEGFDGKSYYEKIRAGEDITTSQINPARYCDFLEPILAAGENVLFIGLSSGVSGSFDSAQIAAAMLRESFPERTVCVFDSLGASLGEGLLVLQAARLRAKGTSLRVVEHQLLSMRSRVYQVLTVDNLKYLRKSGRLSNAAASVGTVLQIKPLLKGNEKGQIVSMAKLRGRRRSIEALAEKYRELAEHPEDQTVGIAHADCPEDAAELEALIRKQCPPQSILTVCFEPVTGSHVGPGTLALFFLGSDGVRAQ